MCHAPYRSREAFDLWTTSDNFVRPHLRSLYVWFQVEEVFLQQGILLRGLAHPNLFATDPAATSDLSEGAKRNNGGGGGGGDMEQTLKTLSNLYRTFGAVPVSPQNYFRYLMAALL